LPGFYAARRARHGDVFRTHVFGADTVVVFDRDEVRRLLLADGRLVETAWPRATRTLIGEASMLNATGARHAAQRRVLGQAFTASAVASYGGVVESAVRRSLAAWADAGTVRAAQAGKDLAFEVAARALVSASISDETMRAMRADFDAMVLGMMSVPVAAPFTKYGRAVAARARLVSKIDALISDEVGAPPTAPGTARNALQLMLAALAAGDPDGGEGGAPRAAGPAAAALGGSARVELQDQLVTQLLAGHETTAHTLSRLLKTLAGRPDVLARLRAEQAAVVAAHGEALSPAACAAMPYTDAVVREVLRGGAAPPIVAAVFRKAIVDVEVGGFRVPAGWQVVLQIGATASAVDGWTDDATVFNPDRWLAAGGGLVADPKGFVPFGAGPHVCLGAALALAELRAILAVLARGYEWEMVDPDEAWTAPLPPTKGLPIRVWRVGEARPAAAVEAVHEEAAFLF
jgi:cytochrome P450